MDLLFFVGVPLLVLALGVCIGIWIGKKLGKE